MSSQQEPGSPRRIVIFGNSGSGKSTLARAYHELAGLPHLDLDTIAWEPTTPPTRKAISESKVTIDSFVDHNESWVIEGCYSDLIELVLASVTELVLMDLSVAQCSDNARNRPWEPHKYDSPEQQDANLDMLIQWIAQYDVRDDTFSRTAHDLLYREFEGRKTRYSENVSNLSTAVRDG